METTDAIKEKIEIADFVRQYVALTPAGKNLKGLCPFHKEKTPSFVVSPDRGIWHCFGCGEGGDVISFLMRYENIEFIEALKTLADKAGIDIRRFGTSDQKKYAILYEVNQLAKQYFIAAASTEAAKPVGEYLKGRGVTLETIQEFQIGLAGPANDGLTKFLTKKGYQISDIERAGLCFKTERGTYWDRFRNRIMFPLFDHFGKVVGFTGRVLPGEEKEGVGKYVNSPETPIYNKSKLLFGFFKTKNNIREVSTAVLVEGQMDLIMAWQDGIKNVVATSGTALTPEHLKVLRRRAENLILAFDNDNAGKMAVARTIALAQATDFNVRVVSYGSKAVETGKEAKDPADIVREHPGKLAELITGAIPAIEFYFDYYGLDRARDIGEKKKAVRAILAKVKVVASALERNHYIGLLAKRSGFNEDILTQEMEGITAETGGAQKVAEGVAVSEQDIPMNREEMIIQRLLSLFLINRAIEKEIESSLDFFPESYQVVFSYLQNASTSPLAPNLQKIADLVQLRSSVEPYVEEKAAAECQLLLGRLKEFSVKNRRLRLRSAIAKAEEQGDEEALGKLLKEYRDLSAI